MSIFDNPYVRLAGRAVWPEHDGHKTDGRKRQQRDA